MLLPCDTLSVMMALSALSADSCNAVDCECYCCPPWMGSAVMCGVAASIFNFRSGNESACTSTACTERYPDGCPDLTNVGGHPTPHRATYSETPVCLDRPQCETVNCECYCCCQCGEGGMVVHHRVVGLPPSGGVVADAHVG